MTHYTLELSSSQMSSFIIEIAVSMRAFVTSPHLYRWNRKIPFQIPCFVSPGLPPNFFDF